jgi:hypothetical protein
MWIRLRRSASLAALAFASATPLFADGGQWTSRFWGFGWGDGYHAPPRTGALHLHGQHGHGQVGQGVNFFGSQPSGLMPGGYPHRGEYDEPQSGPQLPKWLWDPSEETVIVDTAEPSLPAEADPVPAPPPSSSSAKPSPDPSLGLPPSLAPTEPIDSRAMNRGGRIQARSNGWSR